MLHVEHCICDVGKEKVSQSLEAKGVQGIPMLSQAHIPKYLRHFVRQSLMKYGLEW